MIGTFPYHMLPFARFILKLGPQLSGLRERWRNEVIEPHLQLLPYPIRLSATDAIPIVERIQSSTEERLHQILQLHSSYYWLHIYRRIAPENTFGDRFASTVALYRRTLELAFYKHGRASSESEFVDGSDLQLILGGHYAGELADYPNLLQAPHGGVYLGDFTYDDFVTMYHAETLGHLFYVTTSLLRWLYKGAALDVTAATDFDIRADPQLEWLVHSFDTRAQRYSALASSFGVPLTHPSSPQPSLETILVPYSNFERRSAAALRYKVLLQYDVRDSPGGAPNFGWAPLSLNVFRDRHAFLANAFSVRFAHSLEHLTTFLAAVAWDYWLHAMRLPPDARWNFLQRAYSYGQRDSYVNSLRDVSRLLGAPLSAETIEKCLEIATYSEDDRRTIDLWTRGPNKPFIPVGHGNMVLDLVALSEFLVDSIFAIRGEPQQSSEKGQHLERVVSQIAHRSAIASVWRESDVLHAEDGSSREIDAGVVVDDTLFVIECYSLSRSLASDQGKPRALAFRRDKLEAKLGQADSLALWLRDHPRGTNYELPANIRALMPIVVSAFVEYIWSAAPTLWLTKELPRICSLAEVEKLLRRRKISRVASAHPCAIAVGR